MRRGLLYRKARKAILGILRHAPRTRLAMRKTYWGLRKAEFDRLSSKIEVKQKMVLFESYGGRSFACSPKAIYEYMISDKQFDDWTLVWSFRESAVDAIEVMEMVAGDRSRVVIRGSSAYFDALAGASFIIINTRLPEYIYLKPDQTYVQCWHGTPLKKLGFDAVGKTTSALNTASELAMRFRIDSRKWDAFISPSGFASDHLFDAFGVPKSERDSLLIEEGYPRNDALINDVGNSKRQNDIRRVLGIPADKKVLLYAPTWRDDSYISGVGYVMDGLLDFVEMRARLSDDWVILFRAHYYIANNFDFAKYDGFIVDATKVPDINDLYIVSDLLITDYSSVVFDYALLNRPIILFVPDRKHYEEDLHGFYFSIDEIPAPICETTEDAVECIEMIDQWQNDALPLVKIFREKFAPYDDGCVAQRVVERLFM